MTMTRSNATTVEVFELRMWTKATKEKVLGRELGPDRTVNIYDGHITNTKTGEKIFFHSVGELMKAIENMYKASN